MWGRKAVQTQMQIQKAITAPTSQNDQDHAYKVTNYFLSSPNVETDKRKSVELTQEMHNTFGDVSNGTGCFEGTFSLQFKPD